MARPLAKSSAAATAWSDIPALLMLGTGMLLYLALISYVPADLPTWVPFYRSATPNSPAQNFIGVFGAVGAGVLYFILGAGAFLVAALLLGFGGAKLFFPSVRVRSRIGWMAAFVLCGSALAALHPFFLFGWGDEFKDYGPGGCLGAWLAGTEPRHIGLFPRMLGTAGSVIFLVVAYLCTLILMTGLHPITQLQHGCNLARKHFTEWLARRREEKFARASEHELLDFDRQRLLKEQRRLEKQLRRQGIEPLPDLPRASAGVIDREDEFADLPPPRITDNSVAAPALPAPKKPLLADVLARNKSKSAASLPGEDDESADIRFADYTLPSTDLLDTREIQDGQSLNTKELELTQAKIIETLEQFGIRVSPGDITKGPTITRYEVYPSKGVRVDKILSLDRDLMRATRAERINILAPIPGKDTVGIEIANNKKVKVTLRELLESADWQDTTAKIPLALGKDVYGKTIIADLADMPHCLIAGTTGSGKSVCINSIIASILYKFRPEDLRLIMVDPKVVELQAYNALPHLAAPVVTDPKKVLLALRWAIDEMDKRYKLFAKTGVRNLTGYNARPKPKSQAELDAEAPRVQMPLLDTDLEAGPDFQLEAEPPKPVRNVRDEEANMPEKLPYIVILIDELADLMQTAPADVESAIARLAALARAAGIHMIVATQTPRADVVTGVIKANIPSRVAFQVANPLDSRIILNENGAERLLGQGDMLYLPPRTSRLVRAQGVFVGDEEIHRLVQFAAQQGSPTFEQSICAKLESADSGEDEDVTEEDEELVQKCIEIMRQEKKCSTSMLQRRLRLGYTRAARVVDILENRGVVGPENGARGREILVDLDQPLEI